MEANGNESLRDAWHPRLKRLYEYWKAIHPPRGLPERQELIPRLYLIYCQIYGCWTFSVTHFAFATGLLERASSAPRQVD